jgi:hypothetical protein
MLMAVFIMQEENEGPYTSRKSTSWHQLQVYEWTMVFLEVPPIDSQNMPAASSPSDAKMVFVYLRV